MDEAFLNPALAATGSSPAAITNGATEVTSSGSTASQVEDDLRDVAANVAAGSDLVSPYWILSPATVLFLAQLRTTNGERVFPEVGLRDGAIWGIPTLVSSNVPGSGNSPDSAIITLLDAAEVLFADAGAEASASKQTSLQMSSTPNSPETAATVLTSLWQNNLLGIQITRYVRWARRRDSSVAYLSGLQIS